MNIIKLNIFKKCIFIGTMIVDIHLFNLQINLPRDVLPTIIVIHLSNVLQSRVKHSLFPYTILLFISNMYKQVFIYITTSCFWSALGWNCPWEMILKMRLLFILWTKYLTLLDTISEKKTWILQKIQNNWLMRLRLHFIKDKNVYNSREIMTNEWSNEWQIMLT